MISSAGQTATHTTRASWLVSELALFWRERVRVRVETWRKERAGHASGRCNVVGCSCSFPSIPSHAPPVFMPTARNGSSSSRQCSFVIALPSPHARYVFFSCWRSALQSTAAERQKAPHTALSRMAGKSGDLRARLPPQRHDLRISILPLSHEQSPYNKSLLPGLGPRELSLAAPGACERDSLVLLCPVCSIYFASVNNHL